jgi:hypothetical protein
MTDDMLRVHPAQVGAQPIESDANVLERAYLRRRALQEIGFAISADDPSAKIPHDQLAQAYCIRCREIRDPAECEVCALQPLCRRLADRSTD